MFAHKQSDSKSFRPLLGLACLVIILQIGGGLLILNNISSWEHRGQFGDMFGAVNTLFSGLAFAGVIYAILLQRKELALQREELELTRKELARSANAQEDAARLLAERLVLLAKGHDLAGNKAWLEAQPRLQQSGGSGKPDAGERTVHFRNTGARITDLSIESDPGIDVEIRGPLVKRILDSGREMILDVKHSPGEEGERKFRLKYRDGTKTAGVIDISYDIQQGVFIPEEPRRDV